MGKIGWHNISRNLLPTEKSLIKIQIGGRDLCLTKIDGSFYAINDKCPHAGGSLSAGSCTNQGEVVCPLHKFHFSPKTGRNTKGEGLYVQTYPIRESDGKVEVGIKKKFWERFLRRF